MVANNKLGFGCMRLPIKNADDQSSVDIELFKKMVDTFLARGFTYFDTAYVYHHEQSEAALREALVKRYPRDAFTITTKLPTWRIKKEEDLERFFQEQLDRLGINYFDYYWLHNINANDIEIADRFHCWDFIRQKQKEGFIKHIGFSFHDMPEMLDELLTEHPEIEYVQLQINYLDWEADNVKAHANYDVCVKHGKQVIVMEPVKGGVLADVPDEVKRSFKKMHPDWSVASWGIRYAASLPAVFKVLSGMSNYEQLMDNTDYMRCFEPLNEVELKTIANAVDIIHSQITVNCTNCRYCVDGCPKHIPIPDYFKLYNHFKQIGGESGGSSKPLVAQYREMSSKEGVSKASECIKCGRCEKSCPQHLEIREYLKAITKEVENLH